MASIAAQLRFECAYRLFSTTGSPNMYSDGAGALKRRR
jgi:hypothetical protein